MRKVIFTAKAKNDFDYFEKFDHKNFNKILVLLNAIIQNPYAGIGKPEALKHDLSGCYSRRINKEHRLVYRIKEETIQIISCRFHY